MSECTCDMRSQFYFDPEEYEDGDWCELYSCHLCEDVVGCACADDGEYCLRCGEVVCDDCCGEAFAEDDPEEFVGYICDRCS
jgi:hypothetical protein